VSSILTARAKIKYVAIVYRLGHQVLILESGVRFPVAIQAIQNAAIIGGVLYFYKLEGELNKKGVGETFVSQFGVTEVY
jgi:hypothetical protein